MQLPRNSQNADTVLSRYRVQHKTTLDWKQMEQMKENCIRNTTLEKNNKGSVGG